MGTASKRVERQSERFIVEVGAKVRERRKALGITQEEGAARCGMDSPALSKLERRGANLTLRSLFLIARGLGCSPADLVSVRMGEP